MMCPDHRAVDHVGGCMPPRQFGQCLEHGIEHTGRDPSSITSEHAVPLAILIRQMSPLRAGPRDPHHAFKIGTIILRRAASTTTLRRQQRPDHSPFLVCNADPLAQGRLQKPALNQWIGNASRIAGRPCRATATFTSPRSILSSGYPLVSECRNLGSYKRSTLRFPKGRPRLPWLTDRQADRMRRYPPHYPCCPT